MDAALVNTSAAAEFEVATEDNSAVGITVPGQVLDYLVISGSSVVEVLDRLSALTGRPPVIPRWSLGLWLTTSFTTSYDERTIMEHVEGMDSRGIPLSVFHFDCFWMRERHWCDFLWNTSAFRDPCAMLARLKAQGLRVCLWINPYVSELSSLLPRGRAGTTYKVVPHVFRAEEREYFRWLNHMNDVRLLDPESFVQKYDQYKAKIASGRVVGVIDANWEIQDAVNSLKAAGQFDKTYGRFGIVLKPGIKAAWNAPTGFRGSYGVGITISNKDPLRTLKFLDHLSSDEGQVLINWGAKGQTYTVDNGKRVFLPDMIKMKTDDPGDFQRLTGIGNYNISLRYGDGVKDATGNYYTTTFNPEFILQTYSDADKEALTVYKVAYWGDLLLPATELKPTPWAAAWSIPVPKESVLNDFWNVEQEVTRKYIPMAILGKPADFDKTYDQMLAELTKATGSMQDAETALVKDRLTLWGALK